MLLFLTDLDWTAVMQCAVTLWSLGDDGEKVMRKYLKTSAK